MLPLIINNFASSNKGISNYPTGTDVIQTNLVRDYNAGNTASYPGSGSLWTDLAGSGNNLTLFNGPTTGSNYIEFDGVNEFASGSDAGLPTSNNARTMNCWIYPLVSNDFKYISDYGKSIASQACGWIQSNGYGPYLPIQQPSHFGSFYTNNTVISSSNGWLNTNQWSMITFSTSGNNYKLYLNGCLFTTGTTTINTVLNGTLTLATDRDKLYNFNCRIGRWWMYNTQLTDSQVQTNFLQTKNQYNPINLEPGTFR